MLHQLGWKSWEAIHIWEIGEETELLEYPISFLIITWTNTVTDNEFLIKTPVPCGMTGLIVNLQTASCRCWESLPVSVKNHFGLTKKTDFDPKNYKVDVSISGILQNQLIFSTK